MKQFLSFLLCLSFFISMLLFPSATFAGATNGLLLWFQILLPTLLPFLILSNLLIYTNSVDFISSALKPLFQKMFSVSGDSSYAILVGFLCGYPMGAKVIADLLKTNRISTKEGQYLLSFCNNTSMMFIISFIVMQNFNDPSLLVGTLCILMLSPILCSFLFRKFYDMKTEIKNTSKHTHSKITFRFDIVDESIMNGFETITKIGGYIILFSILFSLFTNLPFDAVIPVFELSNGIIYITNRMLPFAVTFPLILSLTSFGGLCAIAQTSSVIRGTKLSIFPYIIQKLITSAVTSLLAILYIQFIHR